MMDLPISAQKLISEYAKPLTRPDWRHGSYCNNAFKLCTANKYLHDIFLKYYNGLNSWLQHRYNSIELNESIIDTINIYGENIFKILLLNLKNTKNFQILVIINMFF